LKLQPLGIAEADMLPWLISAITCLAISRLFSILHNWEDLNVSFFVGYIILGVNLGIFDPNYLALSPNRKMGCFCFFF